MHLQAKDLQGLQKTHKPRNSHEKILWAPKKEPTMLTP